MAPIQQQHQQPQQQRADYSQAQLLPAYPDDLQLLHHHQQQQQLQQQRKRNPSLLPATPSMTAAAIKRSRRRHEPTIAAAQALVNATTNSAGQLSYAPTDVAAMVNLKREEELASMVPAMQPTRLVPASVASCQHQQQPPQQHQIMPLTSTAPMGYDTSQASGVLDRSDGSLGGLDDELCSK